MKSEDTTDNTAQMIVGNPKLMAGYFDHPERLLAQSVPTKGITGRFRSRSVEEARLGRAQLAAAVEKKIAADPALLSLRDAQHERETFFKDAMKNPQRTFDTVLRMSIATFAIGAALIAGAFFAAILSDGTTQKSVIAGISGGGGLVATLASVFVMSNQAIRRINGDNAQIRVILSDFAFQHSNLRAIPIGDLDEARAVNEELRKIMADAVIQIEKFTEPEPRGTVAGQ